MITSNYSLNSLQRSSSTTSIDTQNTYQLGFDETMSALSENNKKQIKNGQPDFQIIEAASTSAHKALTQLIENTYGSREKYEQSKQYHSSEKGVAATLADDFPITSLPDQEQISQSQEVRAEYASQRFPGYNGDGSAKSLMEYYVGNYVTPYQEDAIQSPNEGGEFIASCTAAYFEDRGRHESWTTQGLHDPILRYIENDDPEGNMLFTGSNFDPQALRSMIKGALRTELGEIVTKNRFIGDPFATGFTEDLDFTGHELSAEKYVEQLNNLGMDYSWLIDPLSLKE